MFDCPEFKYDVIKGYKPKGNKKRIIFERNLNAFGLQAEILDRNIGPKNWTVRWDQKNGPNYGTKILDKDI